MIKFNSLSDSIDSFSYSNFLTNGNFSSTSSWTPSNGSISASNNILTLTANGAAASATVYQSKAAILLKQNDVYFQFITARVTNNQAVYILVRIGDGATSYNKLISTPTINQWYNLYQTAKITTATPSLFQMSAIHNYSSSAISNGKSMEIKEFFLINLTNFFGAGNEPSADDCLKIFKFVDETTQPNFSKQIAT